MRAGAATVLAFLTPFLALCPASAEWMSAQGSRLFGPEMSEQEACRLAERRAKDNALKQVAGERLSSEDLMVCGEQDGGASCDLNRITWSVIDGEIKGIRNQTIETHEAVDDLRECVVSLEADVGFPKGQPDPSFDMAVTLNASVFRAGDAMEIEITPISTMYITVFQWLPYERSDRQIARIFPNSFDSKNRFEARTTIPTPYGRDRYAMMVGFPEGMSDKTRLLDEYLMVVGTREPVTFRDIYSLEEFNARLLEIPRSDNRRIKKAYAVVRR